MKIKSPILITLILSTFSLINCSKENISKEIREINGDYYVSLSGNDNNSGQKDQPLRTIQKAVDIADAGKVVVVHQGYFDEFVIVSKSLSGEENRIIIFSEALQGAQCRGFLIRADFITIDGFEIEAFSPYATGIDVPGFDNVEVLNCFVHDCPINGIRFSRGSANAIIKGNKLVHNGQSGISLSGSYGLIEDNEISRTVQFHPKGLEPGSSGSGADADGIRIYGNNHIIRGNRVFDIASPMDKGNIDPHADCIQTFDGGTNEPVMTNTIIDRNYFRVNHRSGSGIMMSAVKGNPCNNITISNNIFEFRNVGINAFLGEFYDIYVYNNLFKAKLNDPVWGAAMYFVDVTNHRILNNISVDCTLDHRKIVGGSGVIDYNLAWNSDYSRLDLTPVQQANEIVGLDPLFMNYNLKHGLSDFRLKQGSPAINLGITIPEVTHDFDGKTRPVGNGYDIGPFEYSGGK